MAEEWMPETRRASRRLWSLLLEWAGYRHMTSTLTPDSVENAKAYRLQTHWSMWERMLILFSGRTAVEIAVGDVKKPMTVPNAAGGEPVPVEFYEHAVIATDAVVLMPGG